jgi:hypothetical protein
MINEYLINGPNNVIRLTNGDKVIYIFGDYHHDINFQQECEIDDRYDSIDIDKLLFKFIKEEKTREFDFFIEDYKYYFRPEFGNTYRKRYIDQVMKLFKANINIENDKIVTNRKYNNFRFHYFDIRDALNFNNIFSYGYLQINFPYTIDACYFLIQKTSLLIYDLNELLKLVNNNKIIDKILNKYNNKEVQKKINIIYKNIFIKNTNELIKNCENFIKLIKDSIDKIKINFLDKSKLVDNLKPIYVNFDNIQKNVFDLSCIITDLYFIRRVLDKSYVKNIVLYTGIGHMNDILYLLVKYFNFKLTDSYYNKNKLNEKQIIKFKTDNFSYLTDLEKNFYNYDEYYYMKQCVNLINFPKNFS